MNAPPNIDPVTAHSDSDVVRWLTNDTRDERFIDNIFAELIPPPSPVSLFRITRLSLCKTLEFPIWNRSDFYLKNQLAKWCATQNKTANSYVIEIYT
jgi:hypothetical protein